MSFSIAVPYFERLKSPSGWSRTDGQRRGFHVLRLHYYFRSQDGVGRLFSGEPLADIAVARGMVREDQQVWSGEIERTDVSATSQQLVLELECASKFASEIAGSLGSPSTGVGLSSKAIAEASTRFREEVRKELTHTETVRTKVTWEYTEKLTVDGSKSNGPLYVQSQYRRRTYDVFLSFVDFLFIDYEHQHFWQRRRRVKYPPVPAASNDWRRRPNATRPLNIPLRTITYWELVERRYPVVAGAYTPDVGNPLGVEFAELLGEGPTYAFPSEPNLKSLYNYSNKAFPLKWTRALARADDDDEDESY